MLSKLTSTVVVVAMLSVTSELHSQSYCPIWDYGGWNGMQYYMCRDTACTDYHLVATYPALNEGDLSDEYCYPCDVTISGMFHLYKSGTKVRRRVGPQKYMPWGKGYLSPGQPNPSDPLPRRRRAMFEPVGGRLPAPEYIVRWTNELEVEKVFRVVKLDTVEPFEGGEFYIGQELQESERPRRFPRQRDVIARTATELGSPYRLLLTNLDKGLQRKEVTVLLVQPPLPDEECPCECQAPRRRCRPVLRRRRCYSSGWLFHRRRG